MLKAAEIEIKKEHQVLMVNKTTSFKKQGKSKGKNKKSGKKAATPPVKPKSALSTMLSVITARRRDTGSLLNLADRQGIVPLHWYDPCLNVMIVDNNDEDPATYEEAMMSPDSNKWQEAMKSEMGSMYDNKVWTLVELPDSRKAVENKWIFKRKTDADGCPNCRPPRRRRRHRASPAPSPPTRAAAHRARPAVSSSFFPRSPPARASSAPLLLHRRAPSVAPARPRVARLSRTPPPPRRRAPPLPDDFAVVMVDEVMADYEQMVLEQPAGEDGEINELGQARRTTIQWRKENIVFPGSKPSMPPPSRSKPPPRENTPSPSPPRENTPPQCPPRDDSPLHDDDSPVRDDCHVHEPSPQASPSPKQKRKSSTAESIEAPNRSSAPNRPSAPKRAKTPQLLPNHMTDEQKAFLAPKKPPKVFIPPNTVKHFAETRQKRAELRTDYDRSLGQSYRAAKAKKVHLLGEQEKQSIPHCVVQPYDDPETASMIEREARGQGADVQYQDYYPTAQVVNKYRYGHDLVKPGELARMGTQMRRLHEWYLRACRKGDRYLTVSLRDEHYFRGKEEINLELEELFKLFNQDALDKAVIGCYCLMKKLECKRGKLDPIGFIDPNTVHVVTLKKGVVLVMDSKRYEHKEWENMATLLQRAWKRFINVVPDKWKPELTFEDYPPRQKRPVSLRGRETLLHTKSVPRQRNGRAQQNPPGPVRTTNRDQRSSTTSPLAAPRGEAF
ncbi:hypothetical protein QYE76_052025 [Lolium multiflorum]|uniref:DUF8039 domain-containing protein n=1 Tax=Lolium multiflorum TaxID=4521 RepID=A0AAD8WJ49_LOLMU|nr:hypothetical protein QYE76_052025 [Lolium multiflorum]